MYPHTARERRSVSAARVHSVRPYVRVQRGDAKVPEDSVRRAKSEVSQELAATVIRIRVDPLQDAEGSIEVDTRRQGNVGVVEASCPASQAVLVARIGNGSCCGGRHSGLRVDEVAIECPLVDERALYGGEIRRRRLLEGTLTGVDERRQCC